VAGGAVDVVLFDLGGVLAEFGGIESMRRLSGIDDEEELWRRWLTCRWVRRFEAGGCCADEFAEGVVGDWQLRITAEAFLAEFDGWVAGPLQGAEDLVASARERTGVSCLTNTNEVHWRRAGAWPLFGLFERCFASFEMGMLKPDAEVFEHVCSELGAEPGSILFLDDNVLNVEAAEWVGLQAVRTRGVQEARAALVSAGVIRGSSGGFAEGDLELTDDHAKGAW
jgi:HAD superfamily hydrolase (TIGR01509 family)